MSEFNTRDLNQRMTRIGFTDELGDPWHGKGHFSGRVPIEEAIKFLTIDVDTVRTAFERSSEAVLPTWLLHEIMFEAEMGRDEIELTPHLRDKLLKALGMVFMTEHNAVVRKDEGAEHVFQVAGKSWRKHDYVEWLISKLMRIVDQSKGELEIGSVLLLGHGEKAVVQIRMPEGIEIGGDRMFSFVAAYSSLDSSWATGYQCSDVRIVCDNTARLSQLTGGEYIKFKHTTNSTSSFNELKVAEALGLITGAQKRLAEMADRMMHTPFGDLKFEKLCDVIVPEAGKDASKATATGRDNYRQRLSGLWTNDLRVAPYRGTEWGAFQAFNTFEHHYRTMRKLVDGKRFERQAINLVTGDTDKADKAALKGMAMINQGGFDAKSIRIQLVKDGLIDDKEIKDSLRKAAKAGAAV